MSLCLLYPSRFGPVGTKMLPTPGLNQAMFGHLNLNIILFYCFMLWYVVINIDNDQSGKKIIVVTFFAISVRWFLSSTLRGTWNSTDCLRCLCRSHNKPRSMSLNDQISYLDKPRSSPLEQMSNVASGGSKSTSQEGRPVLDILFSWVFICSFKITTSDV